MKYIKFVLKWQFIALISQLLLLFCPFMNIKFFDEQISGYGIVQLIPYLLGDFHKSNVIVFIYGVTLVGVLTITCITIFKAIKKAFIWYLFIFIYNFVFISNGEVQYGTYLWISFLFVVTAIAYIEPVWSKNSSAEKRSMAEK